MSEIRKMKSKILDALNCLDGLRYLNEAASMAAESSQLTGTARNALQAIALEIDNKLQSVHDQLQEILEDCAPVEKSNSGENR